MEGGVRKLDKKNTTSKNKGTGLKAATRLNKLRNTGKKGQDGQGKLPKINPMDKAKAWDILKDHRANVFRPGLRKIDVDPVVLENKPEFKPIQTARRSVPHHHKEPLSMHFDLLRREGVFENVDPNEPIDCVLKLVRWMATRGPLSSKPGGQTGCQHRDATRLPQRAPAQAAGATDPATRDTGPTPQPSAGRNKHTKTRGPMRHLQ